MKIPSRGLWLCPIVLALSVTACANGSGAPVPDGGDSGRTTEAGTDGIPPRCSVSIGPSSGSPTTTFAIDWSSDGTTCHWAIDGVDQGEVTCRGSSERMFLPGNHFVTLTATADGGTSTCFSNTVMVSGEGAPTCSTSISPASGGTTSTEFTIGWSSNGETCSWMLDGIPQGNVPCTGMDIRTFSPGNHAVTFTAVGPGGAQTCSSNSVLVEGSGAPICSASISPSGGTTTTVFGLDWASDGTTCTWALDGVPQGSIACTGANSTTFTSGNHAITLTAVGPGGTTSCTSNTVTVEGSGVPTCSASISPSGGTASTMFAVDWASDGTSCTWALDGVAQGSIACTGASSTTLPPGSHAVTLTAIGPGGTTSCMSNTVMVEGDGAPTCTASISPDRGTSSTMFGVSWSSDGTSCTWALDGVPQGSIECSGSAMMTFASGTHAVTLTAVGPGGTSSCSSNTVLVDGIGAPSCSASISPDRGTTSTAFVIQWASDGTSCTWTLDGVPQGSIACSGSSATPFLPGNHSVALIATGPGGSSTCTSNTVFVEGEGAPTCSASISPGTGTTSTSFTADWSSNGTSCTWALDGVPQGSVACTGSATSTLLPGTHSVTLTAVGPGGTTSCTSNSVMVEGDGVPTCSAAISPGSGTTSTSFNVTWSSSGTSCTWALDGVPQGSIECSGARATSFTAGNHEVTLTATGPGGTSSCTSNRVTVTGANLPTCSAAITPGHGTTATEFTASWSSDGTSCTWALDGVPQGSVDCTGSYSSTLAAGTHSVTLTATGPGGTRSCTSNTVTVSGTALPTCSATISPTSGTTSTMFTANWSSNGTSCTWALDGVPQGSVDCTGSYSSTLTAGSHSVTLTATGPGGTRSCTSNTVSVTGPPPPTCSASISPTSGTTTTTFTASWSSDGTSCTWALDGVPQGSVDCTGSYSSTLTAGSHSVTLTATGPGGTRSCTSNTVSVTGPPPPTCSASISPTSGTTTTTFTASWSSTGTSCTWALDGVPQGSVNCTGSHSSTLTAGSHSVTLTATGPGGTRSCISNTVSVTAPPPPTCSASISPTSGTTAATFTASWSSNGTSCTWALDGVPQGSVNCTGSHSSTLAAGSHSVTLTATGPGGTRSCTSNTVTVSHPPPTCSVSISPTSGTTTTTFTASWSSNGTSCTWALNGTPQGSVDCVGSYSSPLPVGSHTVTLTTTGPGGTRSCTSNRVTVR